MTKTIKRPPVHPGRILKNEVAEAGLAANAAALALRIPGNRLTEIINGRRSISADTALRLARYFGTSAQMWMNLQFQYDLQVAEDDLAEKIEREVAPLSATQGTGEKAMNAALLPDELIDQKRRLLAELGVGEMGYINFTELIV